MNAKNKTKILKLDIGDSVSFLDGLDISVNLSIIIYLCTFLLPFLDTRLAIIIMSSMIFLSLSSRIFDLRISHFLKGTKLEKINIFAILPFFYFFPMLVLESYPILLSISIFCISRIMVGLFFSLSYRNLSINGNLQEVNLSSSKFWIFFFIGLGFGFFLFGVINEIYSNDFLNQGGWKVLYLILIVVTLILNFFTSYYFKKSIKFILKIKNEEGNKNDSQKFFSIYFLITLIPLTSFLFFASSNWLPKFSNPENLYFLSYDFLYPFLTILLIIFLNPLANLVGRRKSIIFFNFSIILISFVSSFVDHNSSYSIDFFKLYIALVSSFSICCFNLQSEYKRISIQEILTKFNLVLFLFSIFTPFLFYYFIHASINYSSIYIFFALVYVINYFTFFYQKNG